MQIIIDGYNFTKSISKKEFISEADRAVYSKYLALYAHRKEHIITIVFDGGPFMWPVEEQKQGITIVYVGRQMNADAYIMAYLEENSIKDPLVISSDRQVRNAAAALQLDSLASFEFYRFVQYELKKGKSSDVFETELKKFSGDSHDVDAIMHAAAERIAIKDGDIVPEEEPRLKQKVSHRLAQKLKKL